MNTTEHIINLDKPAFERWAFLADFTKEIQELLTFYLNDFEALSFIYEHLEFYKKTFIKTDYWNEIEFIASLTDFSANDVLIANLYYDILKFGFGCSAFAATDGKTMLHARNLDWHTENNLLTAHSRIFDFQRSGKTIFKTVGWLGFVGVLSGIKPYHFALTLNAVLSNDSPQIAYPISFLLRDVLDQCTSFAEAQKQLENTEIVGDCLILLSGIAANEKLVIERAPTRFATRQSAENFIVVTNDYKKLSNSTENINNLQSTSCGRYNRVEALLANKIPTNAQECLNILQDNQVMMKITVQQMVFNTQTGEIWIV